MKFLRVSNIISKTIALALCVLLLTAPVSAAPADNASKYVETLGNTAIATLSDKKLDKETKRKKIEQLFRDNVDIAWIGKFVLGRFWRQITDDQKKRYLNEYETFLVRNYATRFTDYTSGSFTITYARADSADEFFISMQIKSDEAGGDPIVVDYRVRSDSKNHKSGFVVFDIIVEGVSMITTQRSEFTSVLTNKDMDYLIAQIAKKSELPNKSN
jgi:phospholipid transport system substrate-binding protein